MRIVAGELRGRRLRAPKGMATRPTADRVKEAIFNILGPPPADARVLDLFAGSGALGLEALSRGAQEVVFVDSAEPALRVLRENIEALGVGDRTRLVRGQAVQAVHRLDRAGERFTWIFLDPPYQEGLLEPALAAVSPLCTSEGVVIAEHAARNPPRSPIEALHRTDERRYGDTGVSFYRPLPEMKRSPDVV